MPDREIEMRARECLAAEYEREGVSPLWAKAMRENPIDHIHWYEQCAIRAMIAFAATSAVAADGNDIKHAWNDGYTTGRNHADDPPFAGLGKHNRRHGWELYACSLTDRNLSSLSTSPLPGREEIARVIDPEAAAIAHRDRMCGTGPAAWHDALEKADRILSLSTPPTEGEGAPEREIKFVDEATYRAARAAEGLSQSPKALSSSKFRPKNLPTPKGTPK